MARWKPPELRGKFVAEGQFLKMDCSILGLNLPGTCLSLFYTFMSMTPMMSLEFGANLKKQDHGCTEVILKGILRNMFSELKAALVFFTVLPSCIISHSLHCVYSCVLQGSLCGNSQAGKKVQLKTERNPIWWPEISWMWQHLWSMPYICQAVPQSGGYCVTLT